MNFIPEKLNMPLYMLSRNRFKDKHPDTICPQILRKHFLTYASTYSRNCNEGNTKETADKKHYKHITGFEPRTRKPCPPPRPLTISRDLIDNKMWKQSPNRYILKKKPFESRQGASGAHWAKLHEFKPLKERPKVPGWKFYNISYAGEHSCIKNKGKFYSNARIHKASTRCMVSNTLTCYHDPAEPGPTHYYSKIHELDYKLSSKRYPKRHNPHIFLRNSSVPSKCLSIHKKNTAYEPSPFRYENRYGPGCRGLSKLIYQPELELIVERENRLRFRQLPFNKINPSLYCSPDWIHVEGNGFRRIFGKPLPKTIKSTETPPDEKKEDKTKKQLHLYHDADYIAAIKFPQREKISEWTEPAKRKESTIRFNCNLKRTVRRQLKESRKVSFGSGQPRWKDDARPIVLTEKQLKEIKETLPAERQLRDHPIMSVPAEMIKSKLFELPKHLQPPKKLDVRKRAFKFNPLPEPKLLVLKEDLRPASIDYENLENRIYCQPINLLDFLKDSVIASKKYAGQSFLVEQT